MTRSQILYDNYSAVYGDNYVVPDYVCNIPVGLPLVDCQASELLMPINPVTGHRDGDLSRLFNPTTPASEKELIISNLQILKCSNSSKGLTDDEILMMIPSKYISDPVEINKYLDELKGYRDSLLIKHDNEKNDDSSNDVNPPVNNVSAGSSDGDSGTL